MSGLICAGNYEAAYPETPVSRPGIGHSPWGFAHHWLGIVSQYRWAVHLDVARSSGLADDVPDGGQRDNKGDYTGIIAGRGRDRNSYSATDLNGTTVNPYGYTVAN
jgi:hypothetical protein